MLVLTILQGKKEKDLTAGVDVAVLYEEAVKSGIVKRVPEVGSPCTRKPSLTRVLFPVTGYFMLYSLLYSLSTLV